MRQSGRKLSFQRVGRQEAEPRAGISEAQIQALRPDSIHAEATGSSGTLPNSPGFAGGLEGRGTWVRLGTHKSRKDGPHRRQHGH